MDATQTVRPRAEAAPWPQQHRKAVPMRDRKLPQGRHLTLPKACAYRRQPMTTRSSTNRSKRLEPSVIFADRT